MDTQFFDVVLVQAGNKKIDVIMALRDATTKETSIKMIELSTAKQFVDAAPCVIANTVTQEVGERVKLRLEKAGATVELRPA